MNADLLGEHPAMKKMTRWIIAPCWILAVSFLPGAVLASDVYRHVDKDGVVHYTDKPPSKDAKPLNLPPVQVIGPLAEPSSAPRGTSSKGSRSVAPGNLSVSIVSPIPDETFRGDDRRLLVNVSVTPTLPEGYGLFYLLDGSPQNRAATQQLSFALTGVERGEHLVSVILVNARGTEMARADPVIVHMKPPTVQLTQDR